MKLGKRSLADTETEEFKVHLPYGLIGLPEMRQFDLAPIPGSWPLLSLRSSTNEELSFAVIEPHTLIGGYDIEISNDDAEQLRIESSEDALIYNLVTIHSLQPQYVTANLVGPIVVNRHTSIGKQVIVVNFEQQSARHVLIDERPKTPSAEEQRQCSS
jgi:flagellar assembly factor FliW